MSERIATEGSRISLSRSICAVSASVVLLLAALLVGLVLVAAGCSEGKPVDTLDPAITLLPAPNGARVPVLWGYVDDQGEWIIEPAFEEAWRFSEGLAAVRVDGKWGYIDRTGSLVIDARFTEAWDFGEGLARVATGPKLDWQLDVLTSASDYGFVDKTGTVVIPCIYEDAGGFSEGLAPVMKDGKCGFIDTQGEVVIPFDFYCVVPFCEGLACASIDDLWGYIDMKGEWVIEPKYRAIMSLRCVLEETVVLPIGRFKDGLAPVSTQPDRTSMREQPRRAEGERYGYIDKSGELAFDQTFFRAGEFSEGLALAELGEEGDYLWGFIDSSGTFVIEPQFEFAIPGASEHFYLSRDGGFHSGLAVVGMNRKVGYVDKTGSFVIEPTYGYALPFGPDGFAYVLKEGTDGYLATDWTFIDATGRAVY